MASSWWLGFARRWSSIEPRWAFLCWSLACEQVPYAATRSLSLNHACACAPIYSRAATSCFFHSRPACLSSEPPTSYFSRYLHATAIRWASGFVMNISVLHHLIRFHSFSCFVDALIDLIECWCWLWVSGSHLSSLIALAATFLSRASPPRTSCGSAGRASMS